SYSGPRYFTALRSRVATPIVTELAFTPRTDPWPDATPAPAPWPADEVPWRAPAGPPPGPAAPAPPGSPAAPLAALKSLPPSPAAPPTATCVARRRAAADPSVWGWIRTATAATATPRTSPTHRPSDGPDRLATAGSDTFMPSRPR